MGIGSRTLGRGAAPWGAIGLIALVACVEAFVGRNSLDFASGVSEDWRATTRAARVEAREAQVLCFGDSIIKYGLLPTVVEARSGRPTFNLAVTSGGPVPSYFLLRRALEAGARPEAVVIDHSPLMLREAPSLGPRLGLRIWSELMSSRDILDLSWSTRDPDLGTLCLLAHALPSIRDRFEIRRNLLAALGGGSASFRLLAPHVWRNWNLNRGGQPHPRVQPWADDGRAVMDAICPDSWAIDPVIDAYTRRFLRLAGDRGIKVFWVIPPMIAAIHARRERSGIAAAYTAYARALQDRHSNLVVVDARPACYEPAVFYDPVHLDRQGASIFSADLAEVLSDSLARGAAAPRWITLPDYRDRPVDVPIEDLYQSYFAVVRRDGDGGKRR